jgi:uncharacterized protein YdeI (YjbR/CyaY-like superfamily)
MSGEHLAVPDDLRAALDADESARDAWEALPTSHRREYLDWIAEAKRSDTRARRVARTVQMVTDG